MEKTKRFTTFLILIVIINSFSFSQENNSEKPNLQQAKSQFDKAELFMENRIFDSAYIHYMDAWNFYSGSEEWEISAKIMSQVCGISYKTGNLEDAKAYADTALFILNEALADTLHHLYGSVYHQYGTVEHIQGNFKKARDFYMMALAVREKEDPNVSNIDKTYNNLGLALTRLSDYDEAIVYSQKTVSFCLKYSPEDYYNIGRAYSNLGVAYSDKMDLTNAEKYYRIALKYYIMVLEEPDNLLGDIYLNLSKIAVNNGDYNQAIQLNKRALNNYYSSQVYHRNSPMAYLNLAISYKMIEEYDSALFCIDKAASLKKEQFGEKNNDLAHVYQYKGRIYHAMGNHDEALRYFQKSIIANVLNFSDTALLVIPDISNVLSPITLANSFIWKGTAWRDKYLESGNIEYLESALTSYYAFDKVTDMMFFDFANDNSRFQLINDFYDNYYETIQLAYDLFEITGNKKYAEDAFFFFEKCKSAILTNGISELNAKLFANIPGNLLDHERRLRTQLSTLENQYNEILLYSPEDSLSLQLLSDSLFELKREHEHLVVQFEKEYPSYYDLKYNRAPVSVSTLKNSIIDENTAVIEYFLGDSSLYIISITKEDIKLVKVLVDDSFNNSLKEFTQSTSDFNYITNYPGEAKNMYLHSASYLYDVLFPEKVKEQTSNKKSLCIVPDNKLAYLSFDVLLFDKVEDPESDYSELPYLITQHNIQYTYSATLLSKKDKKSEVDNLYAGFAPEYDAVLLAQAPELENYQTFRDNVGPLSENKAEIENAFEVFGGTTFISDQATEKNFKDNAGNYSIIHLAMHAVLDDLNPLSSKLIFSQTDDTDEDNFLNTYEIYNLSLGSRLAILSACNTANGILDEGEGVLSLSRAFKYAGVNSVISSLWLAHDEATKNIMLEFFDGIKNNLPLDEALRISKLNFLKNADPQFAHPYFWANFMLIGDNAPVLQIKQWYQSKWMYLGLLAFILLVGLVWFLKRRTT